jgi:diphthamide synthase (EF-2-diphthine--ammonia ligase)
VLQDDERFADGLDDSWIGKKIDKAMLKKLKKLKTPIHIAFEGGEAETIVINGPDFKNPIML